MARQALTEKMIVVGVDGFEPSLAKKFVEMGKMPNFKKLIEKGSKRIISIAISITITWTSKHISHRCLPLAYVNA